MNSLGGIKLDKLPVEDLEWSADLLVHDSPLLSEYIHPKGNRYLYYWCDSDTESTRWMLFRISEPTSLQLRNARLPLHQVVPGLCEDSFVFFVDCGAGGKIQQVEIVSVDDVPNEYLPRPGLVLDPIKNCDEESFVIMLDGGWAGQDLFRFENTFRNCYDFLYGYKEWRFAGLPSVPCRGGYSAMHVNAWLRRQIPHADRLQMQSVQYSSPGFMRFEAVRSIADEVSFLARRVATKNVAMIEFDELSSYIRKHRLKDLPQDAIEWQQHNGELRPLLLSFSAALRLIDGRQLLEVVESPFHAAQLLRWFFRGIERLASQLKRGLAFFPEAMNEEGLDAVFE